VPAKRFLWPLEARFDPSCGICKRLPAPRRRRSCAADHLHQLGSRLPQRADGRHRHLGLQRAAVGPYADEGADELRAYELAVEHLNGGGDGGMLNTFSSKALDGTGILGKKVDS
jgi:hypothetical protein